MKLRIAVRSERSWRSPAADSSGMTLVEVLAVVVILGLIAATLTVSFSGTFGKAKSELAKTGIAQIMQKLELYHIETDRWPAMEVGLKALSEGLADPKAAFYLEKSQLEDPWKAPYHFVVPGPEGRPFEIISYGADGRPGGSGEDADLSSANLRSGP